MTATKPAPLNSFGRARTSRPCRRPWPTVTPTNWSTSCSTSCSPGARTCTSPAPQRAQGAAQGPLRRTSRAIHSAHPLRRPLHQRENGQAVLDSACRMDLEGIISKRLDAAYRSGRSESLDQGQVPSRPRGGDRGLERRRRPGALPAGRGRARGQPGLSPRPRGHGLWPRHRRAPATAQAEGRPWRPRHRPSPARAPPARRLACTGQGPSWWPRSPLYGGWTQAGILRQEPASRASGKTSRPRRSRWWSPSPPRAPS